VKRVALPVGISDQIQPIDNQLTKHSARLGWFVIQRCIARFRVRPARVLRSE